MSKIEKKITVKSVCGTLKLRDLMKGMKDEETKGPVVWLMTVVGIARRYKVVRSDLGESIRFLGHFKATNLATGEQVNSGACFLPGAAPEMVFGALGEDADREVQFAFKIGVHYDETAITKYVYDIESLIPLGDSDPLSMLEKSISPARLAAPVAPDNDEKDKENNDEKADEETQKPETPSKSKSKSNS